MCFLEIEISSLVLFIFNTESNSTFLPKENFFFRLFYILKIEISLAYAQKKIEKRKKLLKIENF